MNLLVSALEPSANLHLRTLMQHLEDVKIFGIFDGSLGTPIVESKHFSAMGFFAVVPKILLAKKSIKEMVSLCEKCDVVLLIDAPAFNVPLARAIKQKYPNKKIVYYILPKVWAWKKGRIEIVERFTDVQAYIFPFEQKFWKSGVYVGNPLLDIIPIPKQKEAPSGVIAFLPGSRRCEIQHLMPTFRQLCKNIDGRKTLVVPSFFKSEEIPDIYGDTSGFELRFDTLSALEEADRAVVCSGTATLEAALIGTPFVLVYKAKALDAWLARKFVKLRFVGLANIILDFEGKPPLHEELLQEAATQTRILDALRKLEQCSFTEGANGLRRLLGHGSAKKLAQLLQANFC